MTKVGLVGDDGEEPGEEEEEKVEKKEEGGERVEPSILRFETALQDEGRKGGVLRGGREVSNSLRTVYRGRECKKHLLVKARKARVNTQHLFSR